MTDHSGWQDAEQFTPTDPPTPKHKGDDPFPEDARANFAFPEGMRGTIDPEVMEKARQEALRGVHAMDLGDVNPPFVWTIEKPKRVIESGETGYYFLLPTPRYVGVEAAREIRELFVDMIEELNQRHDTIIQELETGDRFFSNLFDKTRNDYRARLDDILGMQE